MIEWLRAPADIDGGEGLLAIILRGDSGVSRNRIPMFVTEQDNPLQVGIIQYDADDQVTPHRHLPHKRTTERTQEVLIVRSGTIAVTVYTSDGMFVDTVTLVRGDVIVLIGGGHSLRSISESEIVEVKSGPYAGRDMDKVEIVPCAR